MLSQRWIYVCAIQLSRSQGHISEYQAHFIAIDVSNHAADLIRHAPTHIRMLIGILEFFTSVLVLFFRIVTLFRVSATAELDFFQRFPVVGSSLIRVYRSLCAVYWGDHPDVLASLGVQETMAVRQHRMRQIRAEVNA